MTPDSMTAPEDRRRRIPLHLIAGSTEEHTAALRLDVLLREVDRQADLFNRSSVDALRAAGADDPDDVWRHIQSALFAAIVVYRLLTNDKPWREHVGWTKEQAVEAAKWRVAELRRALMLPDRGVDWPIYKVTKIRDSLEHIDERLDRAVRSPGVHSISDWYLSDGYFMLSPRIDGAEVEPGVLAGLRAFWPEAGLLLFDRTELDLFGLDVEMLKLRNNIKEARNELPSGGSGRQRYGGGQIVPVDQEVARERFRRWITEREEVASEFGERIPRFPVVLRRPTEPE